MNLTTLEVLNEHKNTVLMSSTAVFVAYVLVFW